MSGAVDYRQAAAGVSIQYWREIAIHQRKQRFGRIGHKEMWARDDMKRKPTICMPIPFQLALMTDVGVRFSANRNDRSLKGCLVPVSVIAVDFEVGLQHGKK